MKLKKIFKKSIVGLCLIAALGGNCTNSFAADKITSGISDLYNSDHTTFCSRGWVNIQNNGGVYHYTSAATYLLGLRKSVSPRKTGYGKVWATNTKKYMLHSGFYTRVFYGK
ncbi:hypothetical protein [Terrisporobacter vanillatitrophus]|uniref:hypothetical protein n=1 Tax=Terrisporobacter vanillatitrophus TaxID=3058402 RepID=UPI0032422F37